MDSPISQSPEQEGRIAHSILFLAGGDEPRPSVNRSSGVARSWSSFDSPSSTPHTRATAALPRVRNSYGHNAFVGGRLVSDRLTARASVHGFCRAQEGLPQSPPPRLEIGGSSTPPHDNLSPHPLPAVLRFRIPIAVLIRCARQRSETP